MTLLANTPTLGLLVGLPLALLVVAICFALAIWARGREDYHGSYSDWPMVFWPALICGVVVLVGTAVAMFPYKYEYHSYRPVSGTVEQVNNRFLPSGDSVEQKFVVKLAGDPQPYGVQDTRAALLKPGDRVSLKCLKKWQWSARAGYDCRWDA